MRPVGAEHMFTPAPFPTTTTSVEDVDDEEYDAPRHPYSWLHMVVLVLVAFVLGVLIYMVMSRDGGDAGAQAAESVVTAVGSTIGEVTGTR